MNKNSLTVTRFHRGPGGKMVESVPNNEFPLGLRVYRYGYAMSEGVYCIAGERTGRDEQRIVKASLNYSVESSPDSSVDEYCKPVSQKFGIGSYYDDEENYIFPVHQVTQFIQKADEVKVLIKKQAEEKRLRDIEERKNLPALFPHLTPQKDSSDNYREVKANIMADLKKHFPFQKFSFRKRGYDTLDISWTDGVSRDEVQKITSKFEDHETDITGDFRDYSPSNFNEVFGGLKYIFEERRMSEAIMKYGSAISDFLPSIGDYEKQNMFYRIFCRTSFPPNATNIRLERNNKDSGLREELFDFVYDVPDKPNKPVADLQNVNLRIVENYNDRSFVVYGDISSVYNQLKQLGGLYTRKLKEGTGFAFSNKRLDEVKAFVNSIENKPSVETEPVVENAGRSEAVEDTEMKSKSSHQELNIALEHCPKNPSIDYYRRLLQMLHKVNELRKTDLLDPLSLPDIQKSFLLLLLSFDSGKKQMNERGNHVYPFVSSLSKELFDRKLLPEGFIQFETSQDAPYFAIWISKLYLCTLTYCLGELFLCICENQSQFNAEIKDCMEFYKPELDPQTTTTNELLLNQYQLNRSRFLIQ